MSKSSLKWITASLFTLFFVLLPTYSAVAISLNPYNVDKNFRGNPQLDSHTELPINTCDFTITKIQETQADEYREYSDESYANGEYPEDWGCMAEYDDSTLLYYSRVLKSNTPISWTPMGTALYNPFSKNSTTSIKIEHNSINGNSRGSDNLATVDRDIEPSTFGVVQFDVMTHLNISSEENSYIPYGKFFFELDDTTNTGTALKLMFITQNSTSDNYTVGVYNMAINPLTGLKTVSQKIFEGALGNFNWMHVNIFFDLYNDVYNVTIGQYNSNFSDWVKSPVSTVIRGYQYNQSTYELTNIGYRYAPSHLINSLDFYVQTEENADAALYKSTAYIDNVKLNTWKFPAVYADVKLYNSTIAQNNPSGISYMKNSIISCYEPPKYPGNTYSIEYSSTYLNNAKNSGILTSWILSPQWQYRIPLYCSGDQSINVQSILAVLNDLDHPLEEQGVIKSALDSPYNRNTGSSISSQYFEFIESQSAEYYYYFKARYSSQIITVEYYNDPQRMGILKGFRLYKESVEDIPIVKFSIDSEGIDSENNIAGFPFEIFSIVSCISVVGIILHKKRKNC